MIVQDQRGRGSILGPQFEKTLIKSTSRDSDFNKYSTLTLVFTGITRHPKLAHTLINTDISINILNYELTKVYCCIFLTTFILMSVRLVPQNQNYCM